MKNKIILIIVTACITVLIMIGIVFGVLYVTRGNIKSNLISKINAQNIALKDAKIDLSSVDYINTELDFEHGNYIYDIEFSVNGIEYEYLIKAKDGSIIKTEIENEKINNYDVISIDKIKDIILNDSNLNNNDVTFVKEKLDTDDGAYIYDIYFYTKNYEYEYEVNAFSGNIISKEIELINKIHKHNNSNYIGEDKAKTIALNHANLDNSDIIIKKIKLEVNHNYAVYEIEFYKNNTEFEYEINAVTGAIVKFSYDIR